MLWVLLVGPVAGLGCELVADIGDRSHTGSGASGGGRGGGAGGRGGGAAGAVGRGGAGALGGSVGGSAGGQAGSGGANGTGGTGGTGGTSGTAGAGGMAGGGGATTGAGGTSGTTGAGGMGGGRGGTTGAGGTSGTTGTGGRGGTGTGGTGGVAGTTGAGGMGGGRGGATGAGGTSGATGTGGRGGTGTGGTGGVAGTTGAGGRGGTGTGGTGGSGLPCGANSVYCEDFESATVGGVPSGWTRVGGANGDWSVSVDSTNVFGQKASMSSTSRFYYPTAGGSPPGPWSGATSITADVKMTSLGSVAPAGARVCVRYNDTANFSCLMAQPAAGYVVIQTAVDGAMMTGPAFPASVPLASWMRVKLSVDAAGVMTAFVAGAQVGTYTPTQQIPDGFVAIGTQSATAEFDNIVVTQP